MTKSAEYRFSIEAYTPATLPMKRLAEYMLHLARLMGEEKSVHFRDVEPGSAVLVQEVEQAAVPKVRERVRNAADASAPRDVRQLWNTIDEMLADDNSTGALVEVGQASVVVQFPGRLGDRIEIGPVWQPGTVDGVLIRIGGEDKTAHAHLQSEEGVNICEVSRALARQLSPHLYGSPLRVTGRGRWRRSKQGKWLLDRFRAEEFLILDDSSMRDVLDRIAEASESFEESADPYEDWKRIRQG